MTTKHADPVIDEIRGIRQSISQEVGHDPARLIDYYMKKQLEYSSRLLNCSEEPEEKPAVKVA